MEQPTIIRSILTVKKTEHLSPNYIRVTLTGDDVPLYAGITIGNNNKIFLPKGDSEIHFDPNLSIRRTYTHRGIDLKLQEMYIDFVAHGLTGPASTFALQARPGDRLGVAMKKSDAPLYPAADWYLLVADASGIPVIASILETLPATAKGKVFLEVENADEEIPLQAPAGMKIIWLHNHTPGINSQLFNRITQIAFPDSDTTSFGYIAAEFTSVKTIRQFLRNELGWAKQNFYAYSYWKQGKSEDTSEPERRAEKKDN